jgi:protein subunit release factor A
MGDDWGNKFFNSLDASYVNTRALGINAPFKSSEIIIEAYPKRPAEGCYMTTGKIETGIKVTHIKTKKYSICTEHREQYKNKATAILKLQRDIET